jgi:protein phosphatase
MRIGHATHQGRIRELNEDSYLVLTPPSVALELTAMLVVADGMGGHQAGDVASREVIRLLDGSFSSSVYQEQVGHSPDRDDYYVVVLKEVLEQINERLYSLASSRPDLQGMGTTGSVALFVGSQLYLGHAGDSRIYRLRGGQLQRLTHDHTWVAEQVALNALSPEEAAVHPKRHQLTRCLGYSPVLQVDRAAHQVQIGDVLLLCSDGLTGVVPDGEITQVLHVSPTPQHACNHLVDLANRQGGPDNITVVIAQVVEGSGNDIPGGRAFGPRDEAAGSDLTDTLRLPRSKLESCHHQSRRDLRQQLLVLLLAGVSSLACAILATAVLAVISPRPFWAQLLGLPSNSPPRALVFVVVLCASLFGVGTGLYLSRWLPATHQGGNQQGGESRSVRSLTPAMGDVGRAGGRVLEVWVLDRIRDVALTLLSDPAMVSAGLFGQPTELSVR